MRLLSLALLVMLLIVAVLPAMTPRRSTRKDSIPEEARWHLFHRHRGHAGGCSHC